MSEITTSPDVAATAAPAPTPAVATDDLATLRAELAALKSAEAERVAAAERGKAEAEAKAEEERKAKLTAQQKIEEELAQQRSQLEQTRAQLVAERRNMALERLGVQDKFRSFAPQVDPGDPKGAKELEAWAKANPELVRQAVAQPESPLAHLKAKAGTALQQVLSGQKKSTLVTERNLGKMI